MAKKFKLKGKAAADNVNKLYERAAEKADERYRAHVNAAHAHRKKIISNAGRHKGIGKGPVATDNLAASRSYAGKEMADSELKSVEGRRQTGFYNPKPAVIGGTKEMIKKSKKIIRRSKASPQAKAAAKRLY